MHRSQVRASRGSLGKDLNERMRDGNVMRMIHDNDN